MAKKRIDPIKQREKRAKIAAGIGAVLLLAVMGYEIPSILKSMNKKPPPGAYATDAGNRNPDGSIALPNVSVGSGLTGSGQLADTDVPPATDDGQLVSFSVFETKNPFAPQVSDTPDVPAAPSATGGSAASAADKPGADVPPTTTTTTAAPTATTPAPTVVPPTATTPTTTTPTVAPQPTVQVKVDGVVSRVAKEGTFPTGSPVFRLVSFTADTAEIGIVGGSYATGDATLTLHLGRPITLQNQTDGKRYTLELVKTG
jgi:hypothetical protein